MTQGSIDSKISAFIRRHHVLTLATTSEQTPYCSNMFYAWMKDAECFVFTSDTDTRHIKDATANANVAGSIVLETKVVGRLQGLQIVGTLMQAESSGIGNEARKAYISRFPYAAMANLELWIFKPTWMKYTDNTLGFGKKIIWTKS